MEDLETYSAIHKAAGRRSAGGWNDPQGLFQLPAPFTAYGSFRNCTRQNHGTAGNCEAGGFVNSTVKEPNYYTTPYSAIHKAIDLMVPGRSMISTGTIPVEQESVHWL